MGRGGRRSSKEVEEAVGSRDGADVQTKVSHGTLIVFPCTTMQISVTAKRKPEKPKRQLGKGSGFRVWKH